MTWRSISRLGAPPSAKRPRDPLVPRGRSADGGHSSQSINGTRSPQAAVTRSPQAAVAKISPKDAKSGTSTGTRNETARRRLIVRKGA